MWLQSNNEGQAALDALADPKRAEQLQLAAYLTSATHAPTQVCLLMPCRSLACCVCTVILLNICWLQMLPDSIAHLVMLLASWHGWSEGVFGRL